MTFSIKLQRQGDGVLICLPWAFEPVGGIYNRVCDAWPVRRQTYSMVTCSAKVQSHFPFYRTWWLLSWLGWPEVQLPISVITRLNIEKLCSQFTYTVLLLSGQTTGQQNAKERNEASFEAKYW